MKIKAIEKLRIFYNRIRRPQKPKYAKGGIIDPASSPIIGTRADEHEEVVPLSENQYRGREELVAAIVAAGKAATVAAVAISRFGEAVREYAEMVEKEHGPKASDALDVLCCSPCGLVLWEYHKARVLCTNKRILHLADHAKKKRVRKKNKHRIIDRYERGKN